jgi:hypothetical protein
MHLLLQIPITSNIGNNKPPRPTDSGLLTTTAPTSRHLDPLISNAKLSLFCSVSMETQLSLLSQGITF